MLFLTSLGSAPAGPGNFLFLFVDTTACTLFVPTFDSVYRDVTVTGNGRLVQGVVQLTVVKVLPAATVQSAAVLFKDLSVHHCQQQIVQHYDNKTPAYKRNCMRK